MGDKDYNRSLPKNISWFIFFFVIGWILHAVHAFAFVHEIGHVVAEDTSWAHITSYTTTVITNPSISGVMGGYAVELVVWFVLLLGARTLSGPTGTWPPFLMGPWAGLAHGAYTEAFISYDFLAYGPDWGYAADSIRLTWIIMATPIMIAIWVIVVRRFYLWKKKTGSKIG